MMRSMRAMRPAASRERRGDVLAMVHDDHDVLRELLRDLADATDARARRRIAERMRSALVAHRAAEARVIYDRLAATNGERAQATVRSAAQTQHALIDQMLGDLAEVEQDGAGAQLASLTALLQQHIDATRRDLRDFGRRAFDASARTALVGEYVALRWRAPRDDDDVRTAERAPSSEPRAPLPKSRSRAGARSDRAPSRLSETTNAATSAETQHGLW